MVTRRNDDLPVWIPDERRPRQWLDGILAGIAAFTPLPHRLEEHRIGGIGSMRCPSTCSVSCGNTCCSLFPGTLMWWSAA